MFEQSVLPDGRSQRPRLFLLATAAEVLVLAAAIVLPLFWIAGPSIPKLRPLVKFRPRSMPIEVVPVEHVERAIQRPSPLPRAFTAPIRIPTRIAEIHDLAAEPAPEIVGAPSGSGDPIGVFNSALDAKAAIPPKPPLTKPPVEPVKASEPLRVSQGVQEAKLIHRVLPIYPKLALQTRQFGSVHLVAVIGKDGHMRDIRVLSGPVFLVQAALEAVKQWVYKPTYLNNEPVEVLAPISVNFTLTQ